MIVTVEACAPLAGLCVDELADGVELPHAAISATAATRTGAANSFAHLRLRMDTSPFLQLWVLSL
jgi:hypothetical protein